jgi:hypothetical protein
LDSIPGLIPNFPIADNMSEIALAIRNRRKDSALKTLAGALHAETLEVYILVGREAKTQIAPLWFSLDPAYYGSLYGPIESASTKEVRLELFGQALPAIVSESLVGYGLCATACSGWRGHSCRPDFKDERDIGGNHQ